MKRSNFVLALLCLFSNILISQNITQTIRGKVVDVESNLELIGANIAINVNGEIRGASTDVDGMFKLNDIPVGRRDIEITYLGYEPVILKSIMVTSAKEVVLNIEMEESFKLLDAVEISAQNSLDKSKPLNSFAAVSARTFSVEETSRYAAAAFDPARMALNFAGVSTGGSEDLFNEIIIRGNSPSGVLWRLEGVEIPNPNHFGELGSSGGAISMLSSTTLSNSDFYTGAFPSEFGNATSGVFDLSMRNGNNEKREYSFMLGALGLEFGLEGPFSKKKGSSYLINYRYSTLAVLQAAGVNPTGDVLPTYQDLSFKFNFPNKKLGTISIFGLGGNSLAANNPAKDSLEWQSFGDREGFDEKSNTGIIGITHNKLLSDDSYLRTVMTRTYESKVEDEFILDDNYIQNVYDQDESIQNTTRISTMYHKKLSAQSSIRVGAILSTRDFKFKYFEKEELDDPLVNTFNNESNAAGLIQAFSQWKYKMNPSLTLNAGLHYSRMSINGNSAIEPRGSLSYKLNPKSEVTISAGMHSKMEHPALYTFEGEFLDGTKISAKNNLGFTNSIHNVLAYDLVLSPKLRLKAEVYYQHIYNVPIESELGSTYSYLNSFSVRETWDNPELVAEGTGRNIGLDVTLERFFSEGFYMLATGSIYDSKYKTQSDKYYNTRFNGNFQTNLLAGKEFVVGKKGKNIFGINGKFSFSGGARQTPIDIAASKLEGDIVLQSNKPFEMKMGNYHRLDLGISYSINRKNSTHRIMFDIQNIYNRENPLEFEWDDEFNSVVAETQTGLFPFFNYRIEF